ncbi:hypothetical protein [Dyella agri]|uniref:hypothetical protein n=1 Tax=Dyella agri TaxID=1926869 RepID=UPI00384D321B
MAREVARTVDTAELFLYPRERQLFADRSFGEHDPAATALLMQRVLAFLQQRAG